MAKFNKKCTNDRGVETGPKSFIAPKELCGYKKKFLGGYLRERPFSDSVVGGGVN